MTQAVQATRRQAGRTGAEFAAQVDLVLLGCFVGLLCFGVIMVWSTTLASDNQSLEINFHYIVRHTIYLGLGIAAALLAAMTPVSLWERVSAPLLVVTMFVMLLLLLPGVGMEINGSRRWIALGRVQFQPAEAAKLAMVIYTAGYLTRKRDRLRLFSQGIVMIGIVLGVMALLLLSQPDFGSFVVITASVGLMMFLGGIRILHMLLCVALLAATLTAMVVVSPYRMQRVLSFRDPWADPFDSGFQLVQALIAIGRGEFWGVGLGGSIQKLYYLPHANNDFILAVIGEELGLVGIALVIGLFATLLYRALEVARRAEAAGKIYAARLAEGIGLLLVIQAIINMGVNMGLLPTKGLTLPFISYGGSSLVASCAGMGMLLAVDRQSRLRLAHRGGKR